MPRFKQRFSIVTPNIGNLFTTLDIAKVASTVLFITSATYESDNSQRNEVLDYCGEEIIQSIISQGLPTPIVGVTNIENLPIKVIGFKR